MSSVDQSLHEFVQHLLTDETARAAFDLDPAAALADAGLPEVSALDVQEVVPLVLDQESLDAVSGADLDSIFGLAGSTGTDDAIQQLKGLSALAGEDLLGPVAGTGLQESVEGPLDEISVAREVTADSISLDGISLDGLGDLDLAGTSEPATVPVPAEPPVDDAAEVESFDSGFTMPDALDGSMNVAGQYYDFSDFSQHYPGEQASHLGAPRAMDADPLADGLPGPVAVPAELPAPELSGLDQATGLVSESPLGAVAGETDLPDIGGLGGDLADL